MQIVVAHNCLYFTHNLTIYSLQWSCLYLVSSISTLAVNIVLYRCCEAKTDKLMLLCSPSCHAGPPLRPRRKITAATLALFWTSRPSRWLTWIQRCLHFLLATASETCCWETRRFRMKTGSKKTTYFMHHNVTGCPRIFLEGPL